MDIRLKMKKSGNKHGSGLKNLDRGNKDGSKPSQEKQNGEGGAIPSNKVADENRNVGTLLKKRPRGMVGRRPNGRAS